MAEFPPPRLIQRNEPGHPCPSYHVFVDDVFVGNVTRYSVKRPKTGRWVHRGSTVDIFWDAARDGWTRSGYRTRRDAVAALGAHASQDVPS